ncbi:fasciclin domain-containing protein [Tellurirhabdus bombi]|uniref:fasciclin domain-containing protein n=1 Tax=Tellurirhabdus bombi TaxID=2907205 RepID=UPI001F1992AE|nr:fasciclin domain-containing protein [Tellurirhabdus bombi]
MKKNYSALSFLQKPFLFLLSLVVLAGAMSSCGDKDEAEPKSVADVIVENSDFSLLSAAVTRAGMGDALRGGTLTVFAPTNAAFQAAGYADAAAINALPVEQLRAIIQYHVLNGRVTVTDIPGSSGNQPQAVQTAQGGTAYLYKGSDNSLFMNGAAVVQADMQVANGIIHTISRLLMPPPTTNGTILGVIAGNPNLTLLNAAVQRIATAPANASLVAQLTNASQAFTVFAPTDAAFQAANYANVAAINAAPIPTLTAVLSNHIVAGRLFSNSLTTGNLTSVGNGQLTLTSGANGVTVRSRGITTAANVTSPNGVGTNGVVHVVDRVLVP